MTGGRRTQLAGMSAFLAIPALVLASVFLALFFGGAGVAYGSLNDFFVAVTAALLVLPGEPWRDLSASGATGGLAGSPGSRLPA